MNKLSLTLVLLPNLLVGETVPEALSIHPVAEKGHHEKAPFTHHLINGPTWADEPAQPLTFHLRKIEFSRDLVIIGEYGGPVFETVWLAPIKLKGSADEDEETSEIDNLHFNLTLRDENDKEIKPDHQYLELTDEGFLLTLRNHLYSPDSLKLHLSGTLRFHYYTDDLFTKLPAVTIRPNDTRKGEPFSLFLQYPNNVDEDDETDLPIAIIVRAQNSKTAKEKLKTICGVSFEDISRKDWEKRTLSDTETIFIYNGDEPDKLKKGGSVQLHQRCEGTLYSAEFNHPINLTGKP